MSMHAFIQAEDILSICWEFCDFINNNNSTVIKFGLFTENVLCQVGAKYYIAKVFIFECNSVIHSVFCLTTGPKPPPK